MLFRSDRKSTRLNSSHLVISYAVFCLKKKKQKQDTNKTMTGAARQRVTLADSSTIVWALSRMLCSLLLIFLYAFSICFFFFFFNDGPPPNFSPLPPPAPLPT